MYFFSYVKSGWLSGQQDSSPPCSASGTQALSITCPTMPRLQCCLHPGSRAERCRKVHIREVQYGPGPEAKHSTFVHIALRRIQSMHPEKKRMEFQEQLPSSPLTALHQLYQSTDRVLCQMCLDSFGPLLLLMYLRSSFSCSIKHSVGIPIVLNLQINLGGTSIFMIISFFICKLGLSSHF